MAVLGHLIYLPFYEEKVSLFDRNHQSLFSVTRQKAEAILEYMDRNILLMKDGVELEFKPLFRTYFVQQVRSLICQCSTRQPENRSIFQGENPIFKAVAASFYAKEWFVKEIKRQKKINYPDTSYAWISDEVFVTSLRNNRSEGLLGFPYDRPFNHFETDILGESCVFDLEFPTDLYYDEKNEEMCCFLYILQRHQKFKKAHPVVG